MNHFETALEHVHTALTGLRASGAAVPPASADALQRLLEAAKQPMPSPPAVSAPPVAEETAPISSEEPVVVSGSADRQVRWDALRARVLACAKCPPLVAFRHNVVFGVGNLDAELMFVGEAPGEDEDLQGEPFVGRAGELLTKIIKAMGFERSDVYIANVLKCRPDMPAGSSGNRKPKPEEMRTCLPYLLEQIEIIKPKVLVALGATAMEGLTGNTAPIGSLRGRWQNFGGTPLMVTYHPAYLLRNQSMTEKRKVWEDMLLVLERLEKPITEKQRGYFLSR